MTIASGHIQNRGKVRYPDFEHSCVGFASSWLRRKPKGMIIGSTYRYYFGNGYVKFTDGLATLTPQYFFYSKDHLGRSTSRKGGAFLLLCITQAALRFDYIAKRRKNVRSVVTKNPNTNEITEVQQTHYYPFGGIIADLGTGRSVQNHLYNGKELDISNNLWWYDYGARQYDPTAPRFVTPDPLAEKYYPWNYYAYCVNNPINFVDPDGERVSYYDGDKTYVYYNNNFYDQSDFLVDKKNHHNIWLKDGAKPVNAKGQILKVLNALNQMGTSKNSNIKKVYDTVTDLKSNYNHIIQQGEGHSKTSAQGRTTITTLNMDLDQKDFKEIGLTYYELVGHEMKHAYDFERSLQSQRYELFKFDGVNPFGYDELSTCLFENLIRQEEGNRLRTAYRGISFNRLKNYLKNHDINGAYKKFSGLRM